MRMMRRRCCRRALSFTSSRGTTTRPATDRTPIPISGSAGATGPSTRWATRGSTSRTSATRSSRQRSRNAPGRTSPPTERIRVLRRAFALLIALAAIGSVLVRAGQQGSGQTPSPFPLSNPVRERGSSITGAYEGWYADKDGSTRLLDGYFNRNTQQELDIPVGPNNRIEPGGPDQRQPTHFLTARQFGVFAIKVPKDFGSKKLTWTIVANGFTNTITMHLRPEWIVEPFLDAASKNAPPVLKCQPDGPSFTGPPVTIAATYSTT